MTPDEYIGKCLRYFTAVESSLQIIGRSMDSLAAIDIDDNTDPSELLSIATQMKIDLESMRQEVDRFKSSVSTYIEQCSSNGSKNTETSVGSGSLDNLQSFEEIGDIYNVRSI